MEWNGIIHYCSMVLKLMKEHNKYLRMRAIYVDAFIVL